MVFNVEGKRVKILGWGRTTEQPVSGAKPVCDLLEAHLKADSGHRCPSMSETRICVHHGDEKETISCKGDSGGPLMISGVRYLNVACQKLVLYIFDIDKEIKILLSIRGRGG